MVELRRAKKLRDQPLRPPPPPSTFTSGELRTPVTSSTTPRSIRARTAATSASYLQARTNQTCVWRLRATHVRRLLRDRPRREYRALPCTAVPKNPSKAQESLYSPRIPLKPKNPPKARCHLSHKAEQQI
jgi:hypothetical protein